ncbi:hypothetical protein QFC21_003224 [Naganishia friedmannii]|uniref:Uncharacterized protein n=1 Tax=Naganishia friedmannii TaxID=89922 RepID=A0ACC2VRZ6_9TREE|nr:hypothetical protein QFC21_003224 [Naganishia friedmannii]
MPLPVSANDLRAFTAPPSPQAGAVIPIYLSRATLNAVAQQFPYLVDKNQATGGGDVPSLDFRVFDDPPVDGDGMAGESLTDGFDVHGIWVVPLAGFTHPNAHDEWMAGCREVEGTRSEGEEDEFLAAVEKSAVRQGEVMTRVWKRAKTEWKGVVRPAFDGQVVHIE